MLQTTFYDTLRFNSEPEAKENNEIYTVEYEHPKMIVNDPDGKKTELPLNYRPVAGLDVSDLATLNKFFDNDMEERDKTYNK